MAFVLFFKIANLVIELFQVVLETLNFIVCWSNCILNTENVFFALHYQVFLMLNSTFRRINLCLKSTYLMLRGLIWIVFCRTSFPQFTHFFTLLKTHLLGISYLLMNKVKVSPVALVSQFWLFHLILKLTTFSVFLVKFCASLWKLLKQLYLVVFFDAIQLPKFVKLLNKWIDNAHALEQFLTAFVIASVLFSWSLKVLVLKKAYLVFELIEVTLFVSQFGNLLSQLHQQCVLVALMHLWVI